jgi:hypothetical protein
MRKRAEKRAVKTRKQRKQKSGAQKENAGPWGRPGVAVLPAREAGCHLPEGNHCLRSDCDLGGFKIARNQCHE